MPCQGMSPLIRTAAGFSAAIFATSARRAPGLLARFSAPSVNRASPYATKISGEARSRSRTLNVVRAGGGNGLAGQAGRDTKSKTIGKAVRIARCYAAEALGAMRFRLLAMLYALGAAGTVAAAGGEAARWQQHAGNVRIVRDNWGIAHVYGKSDADAVFGSIFAQAEDDFGRIERNYLNGLGRLAQAEGETAVYSDLRQRLFIDPRRLQEGYRLSPA